jgi:hypothetical protein
MQMLQNPNDDVSDRETPVDLITANELAKNP